MAAYGLGRTRAISFAVSLERLCLAYLAVHGCDPLQWPLYQNFDDADDLDGELMPDLKVREQIIRLIRQWKADLVLGPRPNDYHPDHRYTGVLVQDSAYMVTVPFFCPDAPYLRDNPVFPYSYDTFERPNPFRPGMRIRWNGAGSSAAAGRLGIYDVAGRLLRILQPGLGGSEPATVWDGRDERGREVSSGVYFYRLTVGSFSTAKSTLVIH